MAYRTHFSRPEQLIQLPVARISDPDILLSLCLASSDTSMGPAEARHGARSGAINGRRSPRALADINLNTKLAAELQASSDEEGPGVSAEDARAVLNISIGLEQTRLASPTTPAVERSAAIDRSGGFFDGIDEGVFAEAPQEDSTVPEDHSVTLSKESSGTSSSRHSSRERLPSPWRAEPNAAWQTTSTKPRRSSKTRSVLLEGLFTRRRASSGPESKGNAQKSFWDNLPARPKYFATSISYNVGADSASLDTEKNIARDGGSKTQRPDQSLPDPSGSTLAISPTTSQRPSEANTTVNDFAPYESTGDADAFPGRLRLSPGPVRPPNLRRSTSDQSLAVERSLSKVSSLGDSNNWDDIHEQVNSRFKAIKDSLQDANFRLPSISNISVANFTPDFLRERSSFSSWRPSREEEISQRTKPVDPMTRQPYASAKSMVQDAHLDKSSVSHPHFNQALEQLEGDVVVLGGYRGSILRSADPPHRQLWVPIKVGLNLRKVDLEVGIKEGDDERATEKVIPDGMLSHIGPVDISRRLQKRLRSCANAQAGKLRLHDYGYDWRLDPHHLSKQLITFLAGLQDNQGPNKKGATVICHSLGGLITRHAVNQRPDLFRGVVYAGVPQTCVNILGPLRDGDEVLLSSRVLTAQVNFTIRTSFALLPLSGRCFIDKQTKEEYHVDFFDPRTWLEYRLSPCIARALAPLAAPPKPTGIAGYMASLPSLPIPGRNRTSSKSRSSVDLTKLTTAGGATAPQMQTSANKDAEAVKPSDSTDSVGDAVEMEVPPTIRTAVTIPPKDAMEYLTRTLRNVRRFKEELAFQPEHQQNNIYPPIAVIYGKSTPTVFGARVDGREGIKHADAYDVSPVIV